MKMKVLFFATLISVIALSSCTSNDAQNLEKSDEMDSKLAQEKALKDSLLAEKRKIQTIQKIVEKKRVDSILLVSNLIDVQTLHSDIEVDLKYSTSDNFTKKVLYYKIKKAYLQRDVAERLANVQQLLSELKPEYKLLIYDAVRPVSVQQRMWDALDTIPVRERGKFVSNPANRSLHNFGAAIDLTIIDPSGKPLDMGANYDDIRKIAYPSLEANFLKSGELSEKQVENRKLLRKIMQSQGFRNIPSEWWHFNACSRPEAKLKYKVLLEEF